MGKATGSQPDNGTGMALGGTKGTPKSEPGNPRCATLGDSIISTRDFAGFMSALVGDIVSGRIDPKTASAACKAGAQLLRVVELEQKYASKQARTVPDNRALLLVAQP